MAPKVYVDRAPNGAMDNIVSLKTSKAGSQGNFIATVISIGNLSAGSKDEKDWTKKNITIEDVSERITFAAWDDEIKLFELGKTYDFEKPWWKEYKGQKNIKNW